MGLFSSDLQYPSYSYLAPYNPASQSSLLASPLYSALSSNASAANAGTAGAESRLPGSGTSADVNNAAAYGNGMAQTQTQGQLQPWDQAQMLAQYGTKLGANEENNQLNQQTFDLQNQANMQSQQDAFGAAGQLGTAGILGLAGALGNNSQGQGVNFDPNQVAAMQGLGLNPTNPSSLNAYWMGQSSNPYGLSLAGAS